MSQTPKKSHGWAENAEPQPKKKSAMRVGRLGWLALGRSCGEADLRGHQGWKHAVFVLFSLIS